MCYISFSMRILLRQRQTYPPVLLCAGVFLFYDEEVAWLMPTMILRNMTG